MLDGGLKGTTDLSPSFAMTIQKKKYSSDFSLRFETALKTQEIIRPHESIFIGCSGGPDSVALFYLLKIFSPVWNLKLHLLHFNHGLRGAEAKKDADFVKSLGMKWKVPVSVGQASVLKIAKKRKISLEEAAREARYAFFIQMAKKYNVSKIALAHHQDDQAETVLMRMIQGTGLAGLCGIRRLFQMDRTQFVRPLLDFSRKEIIQYLLENKISFRKDKSNQSPRFLRNRIRLHLMPQLASEFNPKVREALARIPEIVGQETELLADLERESWKKVLRLKREKKIYLDRKIFLKFPAPLQFRILNKALKSLDERSGIHFEAWKRLQPLLAQKRCRHSLPRDIDFSLSPLKLTVYKKFSTS